MAGLSTVRSYHDFSGLSWVYVGTHYQRLDHVLHLRRINVPSGAGPASLLRHTLHDITVEVLTVVWGTLTLGVVAVVDVIRVGNRIGSIAGLGALTTSWRRPAVSSLLWLALSEYNWVGIAITFIAAAVGVRAGLAWIRPLADRSHVQSVKALIGDFASILYIMVPLQIASTFVQARVVPAWTLNFRYGLDVREPDLRDGRLVLRSPAAAAWSSDGRYVAFVAFEGETNGIVNRLFLYNVRAGSKQGIATSVAPSPWVGWFPDSRRLLYCAPVRSPAAPERLVFVDVDSGKTQSIPAGPQGICRSAAVSHKGDRLAAVITDGDGRSNVWLYEMGSRVWRQLTHFKRGRDVSQTPGGLAWIPDDSQLVVPRRMDADTAAVHFGAPWSTSRLVLVPASANGGGAKNLTSGPGDCWPVWPARSRWIYYSSHAGRSRRSFICRCDLHGRVERVGPCDPWMGAAVSPDGRFIALERGGGIIMARIGLQHSVQGRKAGSQ